MDKMKNKLTLTQLRVNSFVTYTKGKTTTIVGGVVGLQLPTANIHCTQAAGCQYTVGYCLDTSYGGSDPGDPNGKSNTMQNC